MKRQLAEVTEILDIPTSAAGILMREYKWDKGRLFESFFKDSLIVQEEAGVLGRCQNSFAHKLTSCKTRRNCDICTEESFHPDEMLSMPCGHEFCLECWRGFIDNMIGNGISSIITKCPQSGCSEVVTEEEVQKAAPGLLPKYTFYQLQSFVELNRCSRWCPGPECDRVAVGNLSSNLSGYFSGMVAYCDDCGISFCLKCGEEPHSPISCQDLETWNEKCRNESETANWILSNTKPCPKCSSRIEKNQGCNHMNCQQCKYEFCWICMGDWSEHGANTGGYYRCNKYDVKKKITVNHSDAARAKRELDRYLHYYKRYHAHAEAQKFAKRQLFEADARMVMLQESSNNTTWTDVEFLKTANEQLVVCRRVLKYTYSFAYYMTEEKNTDMQKERFEHNQELLERFTENLSELSEQSLDVMNRTLVVNQTRVVGNFMRNILSYVENDMVDV